MEMLKESLLSYCDMEQSAPKHLDCIDSLAMGANPSSLVSCMNQQNCMHAQDDSGNAQLKEKDFSLKKPTKVKIKKTKKQNYDEQNSKTATTNKTQWRKEKDNKYLNRPYRNYKGVEVKSKEFVDYDCQCTMKCHETLTADDRRLEFEKFWELGSYEAQAIFLVARVDEHVTKKNAHKEKGKKSDSPVTNGSRNKKQFSRTYVLKAKPVCRDMFVKTLGITSKRINTALVKMRAKKLVDLRGVFQGGKNKISEERYNEVVQHIKKVPRYRCSHTQSDQYSNNDFMFQPPLLSMTKMYEQYSKEVANPVSLSMYKKIYYGNFNLKVKGSKKEGCSACKNERKIKSAESKKQQEMAKLSASQAVQQEYIVPDYVQAGPHTVNCTQTWFPAPNFPVPQHNPALHYFDQPFAT